MKTLDISIIYVYYNTPAELLQSLESIQKAVSPYNYEVIIVDNASTAPLPKNIFTFSSLRVINNAENKGYGTALNQGAKKARAEYVLFVNPDTIFHKRSLALLLERLKSDSTIGVIGPKMLDNSGRVLPTFSGFPFLPQGIVIYSFLDKVFPNNPYSKKFWLPELDRNKEHSVAVIGGACMMMPKNVFQKVKGFDERFFLYFEEQDFCYRVKKAGLGVVWYPKATITHVVGQSLKDKDKIKKYFEKSRFLFFKKYHGYIPALVAEIFFRMFTLHTFGLMSVLVVTLFLNTYKISELMIFIGDAAHDYLAARDMILTGSIPLVGIRSSVTWLFQGPLSVYFIGLAFLVLGFHPVAPALLFGAIGVATTYLVYLLGVRYFSPKVGLLASAFYATSPLVVINARLPYHTSLIPFVTALLLLILHGVLHGKKYLLPFLFFFMGLLLQVELSNSVIFPILFLVIYKIRAQLTKNDYIKGALGFGIGVLPFILYDLTHKFVYAIGFPLWIVNRMRLFLGLTLTNQSTTANVPHALATIGQQIAGIIFPSSVPIVVIIVLGLLIHSVFVMKNWFAKRTVFSLPVLYLWLFVPLFGFFLHTTPGSAYFPLLFPVFCLLIGFLFSEVIRKFPLTAVLFLLVISVNSWSLVANDFFVTTQYTTRSLPPASYNFGSSWKVSEEIADAIISDAKKQSFQIKGGGFLATVPTSLDTFRYLSWWKGGLVAKDAALTYVVYVEKEKIPQNANIIFQKERIGYVVKYE